MIIETFRQALQNVWSNKLRTFLTMLGIIIGVMAVIVIVGLGNGMTQSMRDSFSALGTNALSIQVWGYGSRTASVEDVYKIADKNKELISAVSPQIDFSNNTPKVGTTTYRYGTSVYGVDEHYAEMKNYTLAQGRGLQYMDIKDNKQVCIIGDYLNRAAYGGNAAMMHYHATPEDHAVLEKKGFLLVDSGATYMDGTTDITRTYPLGELTEDEKRFYTWTLQSHIDLARAVWLDYCECKMIDIIAREPLWRHLINYRCGTGHSVSFVGNVHEGPHALNSRNTTRMRPGMVVTDEPGVYETDLVGIRIENELVCIHKADNQYGTFLGFEPLTFVPIATSPILSGVLDKDELAWLNDYHRQVFAKLAPHLNAEERVWLAEKCASIGC